MSAVECFALRWRIRHFRPGPYGHISYARGTNTPQRRPGIHAQIGASCSTRAMRLRLPRRIYLRIGREGYELRFFIRFRCDVTALQILRSVRLLLSGPKVCK